MVWGQVSGANKGNYQYKPQKPPKHIYMKQQIKIIYKQGCLEASLGRREGKSGSSISQATPTGVREGFDMTGIGGI